MSDRMFRLREWERWTDKAHRWLIAVLLLMSCALAAFTFADLVPDGRAEWTWIWVGLAMLVAEVIAVERMVACFRRARKALEPTP